ncbi:MAG: two-component system, NtrC family, sensor histidine kinase KinB [Thermodesulfobacteriota bacterium]|nr:two-component system, NtrC family, sensor histidine kinase KinB [Thermodesulfobacteriota bacterium]
MLRQFLTELEQRSPVDTLLSRYAFLFQVDNNNYIFSQQAFADLLDFIEKGSSSCQHVAAQAGAKWSGTNQKIALRNAIHKRGFVTPSCLWAYRYLRGNPQVLFEEFAPPEMCLMQIVLLKDAEPTKSIPFLIQRFLQRRETPQELKNASSLCLLSVLNSGVSAEQVRQLRSRYPGLDELYQWKPSMVTGNDECAPRDARASGDFHQLIRSIGNPKELSSLTRTVYLVSQFYVPLTLREWRRMFLDSTDGTFFRKLLPTGLMELTSGGLILSSEPAKRGMARKFLYESYAVAKDSIQRAQTARIKEEHQKRVRHKELDRQALEMLPDGIVCIDGSRLLFYMNPAAERLLHENHSLKELLFGKGSLENNLRKYSKERVLVQINARIQQSEDDIQIFGDHIVCKNGVKRFDVTLGPQVILIRDTTDQHLISREVGRLYRHEMKAALDVLQVGIETSRQLVKAGKEREGLEFLEQAEKKRAELYQMLEERIDFIRLHSDAFSIRPTEVNLSLVVERCVGNYRDLASARKVSIISNHLDHEPLRVSGEERFLMRAIDNILRNAVKFSRNNSQITVTLKCHETEALVLIEDEGPGIPPENLDKIFQLGFTTSGSGRGLYMARRIASAHGGRIDVTATVNKGATFIFRLPIRRG